MRRTTGDETTQNSDVMDLRLNWAISRSGEVFTRVSFCFSLKVEFSFDPDAREFRGSHVRRTYNSSVR